MARLSRMVAGAGVAGGAGTVGWRWMGGGRRGREGRTRDGVDLRYEAICERTDDNEKAQTMGAGGLRTGAVSTVSVGQG